MATKASTDITVRALKQSPLEIIQAWLERGWVLHGEDKKLSYLPLHDDDLFEWQSKPASQWDEVKKELAEKAKLGEIIGLVLYWGGTAHGGHFHFNFAPNLLSISWDIGRKAHAQGSGKTDLDWYEAKVVTPLLAAGVDIVSVKSEDEDSSGTVIHSSFHDAAATRRDFAP